jgi:hypothetical protein
LGPLVAALCGEREFAVGLLWFGRGLYLRISKFVLKGKRNNDEIQAKRLGSFFSRTPRLHPQPECPDSLLKTTISASQDIWDKRFCRPLAETTTVSFRSI